ncbi:NmrA family NAD(P)-binding protein [Microbispora siamensis]
MPAALSGVERAFLFPVFTGVDGFLDAARRALLDRRAGEAYVLTGPQSLPQIERARIIGEQHLRVERAVAASGLPWTFVRPDAFMTNDLAWAPQIAGGGVVREVYGDAALAPVDPRDIAAVAVRALLDRRAGEAYVLTGQQSLTQIERARIIAETIGRPVRFEEVPREQAKEQMPRHGAPEPVVDDLLDGLAAREGRTAEISPAVEEVTGRPAFTYAQWVAHNAAAFDPAAA